MEEGGLAGLRRLTKDHPDGFLHRQMDLSTATHTPAVRGHVGVPGHRGRPESAGQRRPGWDGAGLGPATGEPAATYKDRTKGLTPRVPVTRAGGESVTAFNGHQGAVNSVCPVTAADRNVVAAGNNDGTVQVWEPAIHKRIAVLEGHQGEVQSVFPVTVAGRNLLASGSRDGTLLVWDPANDEVTRLAGHQRGVRSVCPVTVADQDLLASGGEDNMVRLWDPATGVPLVTIPSPYPVTAVHEVATLLAIGHDSGVLVVKLNLSTEIL